MRALDVVCRASLPHVRFKDLHGGAPVLGEVWMTKDELDELEEAEVRRLGLDTTKSSLSQTRCDVATLRRSRR